MPSGIEFPADTRAKFLEALERTGKVSGPGGAAELVGVAVPTLYAWRDDPEFAASWDQAVAARSTILAESGLAAIEEIIADEFHKDRFAASKFAVERGENRALKVEISGDPDKPVLVTHQRGLTLADLISDPRAARLVEQARRQLPAAPEVLAEPDGSVDPASDLPPGPVA